MRAHIVLRIRLLRETLKQSDAEAVQDLLHQANLLMQMVLKHEVSIDLGSTARENTLLGKVAELVHLSTAIGDDELKAKVSQHVRSIMSACLSTSMCSAAAKPDRSDTMSTQEKLRHVHASLLSSFQT